MEDSPLKGSRILLGVSGGIAAYKSAELCRMLARAGAQTQVIMTASARQFVAPLTFETLTGRPVYSDMFDQTRAWEIEHVTLAKWGDAFVVAPATANSIAKMAAGLADDPISTTALVFRGPTVLAPAMNRAMWDHPQTQENIERLRRRGARIVAPGTGELACGDIGAGRLADLDSILRTLESALEEKLESPSREKTEPPPIPTASQDLAGKRVLVTAGPTVEPIDPVRHLSNPSTGRMGMALASEAARRGADVTLVLGPTQLDPPTGLKELVRVGTARQMRDAVLQRLVAQNIVVFTAAVADYTPESPATEKMKKEKGPRTLLLRLERTPDIAALSNAARLPGQTFVGFAAETNDLLANARRKMNAKGFDIVAANEISAENPAFAARTNSLTLLSRWGRETPLEKMPKEELAAPIWDFIIEERARNS